MKIENKIKSFLNEVVDYDERYYEMHIVNVKNEEESKFLQRWAFENGYVWNGSNGTNHNYDIIAKYKEESAIRLNNETRRISYGNTSYYKKIFDNEEILSLNKFKKIVGA
jgi:hypothetical protein